MQVANFSKADVLEVAGPASYELGIDHLDAVDDIETDAAVIYAAVGDAEPHEVELHLHGERLAGACDCPKGERGDFCEHCVALALVFLYESQHADEPA